MHAHRLQFQLRPQSPAPVANVTTVEFNLPKEVIMQMSLHEVHYRKVCQRRPCTLTGYHTPLPCSSDMSCNTIGLLMPEQTSDMTQQVLRCGAPGNYSQDTVEHKKHCCNSGMGRPHWSIHVVSPSMSCAFGVNVYLDPVVCCWRLQVARPHGCTAAPQSCEKS